MAESQPTATHVPPQTIPVGQTFGRWTVIGPAAPKTKPRNGIYWRCRCSCPAGTERDVKVRDLYAKVSGSCGCLIRDRSTRHGNCSRNHPHPLYALRSTMLARCLNPNCKSYHDYGGRGITVCQRWQGQNGLDNFTADMGPRPSPKHSVDRIDNDGPYAPENCRWATRKEQRRNRRRQRLLTYNGRTQCVAAWAEEFAVDGTVVRKRLKRGWSVEAALTTPVQRSR